MSMSDPLADMMTRIRNAVMVKFDTVVMLSSKNKARIAKVLKDEGFISDFMVTDEGVQGTLRINLKYGLNGESVITGIRRISKPGLRKYSKADALPKVLDGLGISIISTSKGIVTDRTARAQNIGGEILCEVW
jgi:small subunit ribosomal protein S8